MNDAEEVLRHDLPPRLKQLHELCLFPQGELVLTPDEGIELVERILRLQQQVDTLREALLNTKSSTEPDGPCWCQTHSWSSSAHATWCKQARAALAQTEPPKMSEWISVNDPRKPPPPEGGHCISEQVLLYVPSWKRYGGSNDRCMGNYLTHSKSFRPSGSTGCEHLVTHWQPLPEPPKEQ